MRFNANGMLDAGFGTGGLLTTTGSPVKALGVQQADSKIVALGFCDNGIGLARYFGP